MSRIEIIIVGREILTGRTLERNAQWMARKVSSIGGQIKRITVVDDDVPEIAKEIKRAIAGSASIILMTGGLGPTFDDRTLEAVADAVGRPLRLDPEALDFVAGRYASLKQKGYVEDDRISEPRKKMAVIPQGAAWVPNPVGTAPGVILQTDEALIVCMPGVPAEMKAIFEGHIENRIREALGAVHQGRISVVTTVGDESILGEIIEKTMKAIPGVYIKSRPERFGRDVKLRVDISASGAHREDVERRISEAEELLRREAGLEVRTRCGRMDHGGCGLIVQVRKNRIVGIRGDPKAALSRGYCCFKGRRAFERLTHPERLTAPLKRVGARGEGKWREISWSEALDEAARGLNRIREQYGAKAVAFCQGAPKGLEHFMLIRLANVFGSPNVVGPQNICHMPREISAILTCGFYPVADYDHPTGAILLWGSNLSETNEEGVIHVRLAERLKADRCPLIVVDPVETALAKKADRFLQLRPGTDAALALAFLNVIIEEGLYDGDFVQAWTIGFDSLREGIKGLTPEHVEGITGVKAEAIREAARLYGKARPAILQWGNGIEHTVHAFDVCRALLAVMALCGNLDQPGGNIKANMPPVMPMREFARTDRLPGRAQTMLSASAGLAPGFMVVPPELMKRAILTGRPYPIRAAYVHVSNPVLCFSESPTTVEALKSLEFLAVSEVFMSPTAMLADLVLPAATQFEFNDIGHYGLSHGFVLARRKLVDPPERCWPDIKILNELGKALGHADAFWEDYEEMLEEILEPSGLSYAEFARRGILEGPQSFKKYEKTGFKTPSGKVELALSRAQKMGLSALPRFQGLPFEEDPQHPLMLTSMKPAVFFCSADRRIQSLRKKMPKPPVLIHPSTAAEHGISEGDPVAISTRHGRIVQFARITEGILPGVVCASHGWSYPEMGEASGFGWREANINMLTSGSRLGEAFATPNLRAIPCRIEKA